MNATQKFLFPTFWKVGILISLIFAFFMVDIFSSGGDFFDTAMFLLVFPVVVLMKPAASDVFLVGREMLIPIVIYLYLLSCLIYFIFGKIKGLIRS